MKDDAPVDVALRDYFAGHALAGIIAKLPPLNPSAFAEQAYKIADAMLVARGTDPDQ